MLVQIPKEVTAIITAKVKEHPSDITAGVKAAERAIRKLPDFEEQIAPMFITHCVQELFYDARHHSTVATKKEAGKYGGPAKVIVGKSEEVRKVYRNMLDTFFIGSTVLGDVRGEDIPTLCAVEGELSNGHLKNKALLEWAASQGVKGDKRIRDVLQNKKVLAAWSRICKQYKSAA